MEHKLITPNEGKEKIYSLLEEISSSGSSSNVKLLELIVGLEGRFSKANSSNKLLLNKMRDLQSERDEWIRAFYSIVDHLSDFALTKDNSVSDISDRMSSLSVLLKESSQIEDELNSFLEEAEENDRYIHQVSEQYSEMSSQGVSDISESSNLNSTTESDTSSHLDEKLEDDGEEIETESNLVNDDEIEEPKTVEEDHVDSDESSEDDFDEGFAPDNK